MIFHWGLYHGVFMHSLIDRHLGCFHGFSVVTSAAVNTLIPVFYCPVDPFLLEIHLGVELLYKAR